MCNTGECVVAYCCLYCGEILISCRILHVVCLFRFRFRGTSWAGQSIFYKTKRVSQFRFRFRDQVGPASHNEKSGGGLK